VQRGKNDPVLLLRPLTLSDEEAFRAAQRTMAAEEFPFGFDYDEAMPWSAFLEELECRRVPELVPAGWVPSTFLVADVDGRIVGRSSIRHKLNAFLAHEGGHIGYCVLPPDRGRGYATEILRHSLRVARDVGITRALLCCDDTNLVSANTIERCGGVLDSKVRAGDGTLTRRYWINVGAAPA
jgi:predicted acetyltransferase